MICKNCNKEVPEDYMFCPYCGKRVDGNKNCPKCGALIPEDFAFCPKCGANTNAEPVAKKQVEQARPRVAADRPRVAARPVAAPASRTAAQKPRVAAERPRTAAAKPVTAAERPRVAADRPRPVTNAEPQRKVVKRVVNGRPQPVVREEAVTERPPVRRVVNRAPEPPKPKKVKAKRAPINWNSVKESMNTGLINRIVLLTVAVIFFICSFFSVVTFNMTDVFKESLGSESEKIRLDGDIKVDYSAIDLINYAFFVMGTDYDSAIDYVENYEMEDSYDEILEDEDNFKVSTVTGTVTITSKGCKALSDFASDMDVIKLSYASFVIEAGEGIDLSGATSSMVTAGFLSLANIICATVVLILAAINMFMRKGKSGVVLVAVMFAMAVGLGAILAGITVDVGFGEGGVAGMGGALAAIVAFAVIYFAYRLVVRILTEKNESVKSLVANAVALVAGIVVVCCATVPAVNATYTYVPADEDARNVKYEFSYSQFETFDQYFFDMGEDLYKDSEELKAEFDTIGNYYSDVKDRADGEALLKTGYGLTSLLNTKFISEEYGSVRTLLKLQPILSVIAVYCAALAISFALAGLCGGKNVKAIKGIAFIVILIAAAYGMFSTILLNTALSMSELLPKVDAAVGTAPIVQLIFAVVGIVGVCVALVFKNKQLGKKEVYDPLAEYDDEDADFTEEENSAYGGYVYDSYGNEDADFTEEENSADGGYVYDSYGNEDVFAEEETVKDDFVEDDAFVQEEPVANDAAPEETTDVSVADDEIEEISEVAEDKEVSSDSEDEDTDKSDKDI